jgi:hypothetical protein
MNGRIKRAEEEPRLAFPLIGKVKCGKKSPTGHPMSVDYFIPTGRYSGYFEAAYGEKPNVLQVVFMHDDPKLVCDERYEIRNPAGQLVASGDGINFRVFNPQTEQYQSFTIEDHPDMLERVAAKYGGEWKTILTLRFLLPKISGIAGHWELRTGAKASSIPDIIAVFDAILAEKGFIKGIIFDLHVAIHKSNKPGSKSRYPVLTLVPNHSKENIDLIKNSLIGTDENLPGKRISG